MCKCVCLSDFLSFYPLLHQNTFLCELRERARKNSKTLSFMPLSNLLFLLEMLSANRLTFTSYLGWTEFLLWWMNHFREKEYIKGWGIFNSVVDSLFNMQEALGLIFRKCY
jgi:hypothetical protein